jgi:hypothetical protein|tara:strand:- start:467 stop:730 length:264 start_codon:yes stop_codon:yes gene_type:complete
MRSKIATNQKTGQTTIDGEEVGMRLWIGHVSMDFIEERDIVIRASSQADFEARVQEHHENMARQKGFEPGYLAIDFAMPKSEFDAKG